jgi:hypothetical protein
MTESREDPIVSTSRREALVFLVLWGATLAYTVGYCYTHGYDRGTDGFDRKLDASLDGMAFFFGWPDWVFWGIFVPWCVCAGLSILIATIVMRDAPLGEDVDEDEVLT